MRGNGIRDDQVTQVRGFADQRLRKADAPQNPSNRRISLIVQYLEKKPSAEWAGGEKAEGEGGAGGKEKGSKETGKAKGAKGAEAGEKKKEWRGFAERLFRGKNYFHSEGLSCPGFQPQPAQLWCPEIHPINRR